MNLKSDLNKFLRWLRERVWCDNFSCIVCNSEIKPNDFSKGEFYCVCPDCKPFLTRISDICLICGTPVTSETVYCMHCTTQKPLFDMARSTLLYQSDFKKVVCKLKFDGGKWMAKYLAPYLVEAYDEIGMKADVVIPVPLSKERKRWRGFNQSAALAAEFCNLTNLPLDQTTLKRIRDTQPQSLLSRKERLKNLKDAFEVVPTEDYRGKTILLLDDIYTTGATFNECAKVLKRLRPEYIICVTLATPPLSENQAEAGV